jgi:hypothetical protein
VTQDDEDRELEPGYAAGGSLPIADKDHREGRVGQLSRPGVARDPELRGEPRLELVVASDAAGAARGGRCAV